MRIKPVILSFMTAGVTAFAAEVTEISSAFVRDLEAAKGVRRFEKCVTRLVRQKRRRECRVRLEFGDPKLAPALHADFSRIPWHVQITGGRAWEKDLHLASRLGGILAAACEGSLPGKKAQPFPQWLTAAMFHQMQAGGQTERYFVNNRRFPAAGALLEKKEVLNPKAFALELESPADSAERLWQQEFGRLLLDLSLTCGPGTFGTKLPFPISRTAPGKKYTAEEIAAEEMPRIVWHNPESIPAEFLEQDFRTLEKIYISALDKEGVPTGESIEITLDEMAEKLRKHPEEKLIRDTFSRRILELCRRVPAEFAVHLNRLVSAVRTLDFSAKSVAGLKKSTKECRDFLLRRKARARLLDQAEKSNTRLQRYAPVFSCDWSFSMLNQEEKLVLDRTEQFYNR